MAGAVSSAASKPKLAANYKQFLDGPTSILITRPERQSFLELASDEQRDSFIDRFWEVRNPTPGIPNNEFKEEFYRRLAYTNSFYGKDAGTQQGWRTPRGKTYILFGKPQTTANMMGNQEIYPVELWFYSNPGLSELPPFFYVLFFEGDGVSGYRFYHPYIDGPDQLLRSGGKSKAEAYRYLRSINSEIAHATLSFIPGEPVNTDTFSGSMQSMQIVNAIEGFAEMPSYAALIAARRQRLERVNSKIEFTLAETDLTTLVVAEEGKPWLHWRMQVSDPAQPAWAAGKANLHVSSRLFSRGKLVLEQSDDPSFGVPAEMAEKISKRPLVYEDRMPIEAGDYQLAVSITNKQTNQVYEISKAFTVQVPAQKAILSDVLVVGKREQQRGRRAFSFSGVEFHPAPGSVVRSSTGLSILYQIQLPAQRPSALNVHYVVGQVSSSVKKTFDESTDLSKFDASGALLTAKTLPIDELGPGHYRLSIRVEDPASGAITATAIPFVVLAENPGSEPIVIAKGQSDSPQGQAAVHYERALCFLAQDRRPEAVNALRASFELSRNPAVKTLLDHLAVKN